VIICLYFAAYHSTTMANTVGAPLLVFSKKGGMPALLSHYRPNKTVFAFTGKTCLQISEHS
jgi:pyruvate kinase